MSLNSLTFADDNSSIAECKSPTVNPLEDPDWCAIRVMVKRSDIQDVMEQLEAIGASAILETHISNCRL